MERFTVQQWKGSKLETEAMHVSYDAALSFLPVAKLLRRTARIMSETRDYVEVYAGNDVRRGTFAETTLVAVS